MNILLVEDEKKIVDFVCCGFREQGFTVEHCADGNDGFAMANAREYDVIVLDIMLPGRDGLSILKGLRKAGKTTPVLLLTARNELDDRIEGLNLGADDYLAKPFFVEELIARIHALQRRVSGERQNILAVGDLRLDRISREVSWRGQSVLRVVRCLPSSTGLPGCGKTLRAGVGQASREETAGYTGAGQNRRRTMGI